VFAADLLVARAEGKHLNGGNLNSGELTLIYSDLDVFWMQREDENPVKQRIRSFFRTERSPNGLKEVAAEARKPDILLQQDEPLEMYTKEIRLRNLAAEVQGYGESVCCHNDVGPYNSGVFAVRVDFQEKGHAGKIRSFLRDAALALLQGSCLNNDAFLWALRAHTLDVSGGDERNSTSNEPPLAFRAFPMELVASAGRGCMEGR
jgi:hypothetical protein